MDNTIIENDILEIWDRLEVSEIEKKSIILTGGTGLIGTYFLFLFKRFNEVSENKVTVNLIVHNNLPEHLSEFETYSWLNIIRGDLSDLSFCEELPEVDYVIHAAGYGQPGRFLDNKIKTIRMNTITTDILLSKLKKNGKALFVSSSEIYSGSDAIPYKETDFGCTTPQHPRACYIEGKRCGEAICAAYRENGINVKVARVSLAYGPGVRADDKRVLYNFIQKGKAGKIELQDSGVAKRTYCYVSDTVEILWDILIKGNYFVYNVGGESHTTIYELAKLVGEKMGATVYAPKDDNGLKGAPTDVFTNMEKAKTEFNKYTFISLEDGIERTIGWYKTALENMGGYSSIVFSKNRISLHQEKFKLCA